MAPSFSKNAILMGAVDHFCLVCETHLKCEEDVLAHIAKPVHKKSLDATQFVDTLTKDHIRKIKNKYFCEFCNFLMNTLAKVRVHVDGQKHVQNIRNLALKRKGKVVIAYEDIIITEQAWNGLHDNSCALCNTEYEEENIHKTRTTHVLNLVQIKVEQDEEKNIYRKIDQTTFHCLTCNTVLALDSISSHWNTPEHKQFYEACRDVKQSISVPIFSKSLSVTKDNTEGQKNYITTSTQPFNVKKLDPEALNSSALNKDVTNNNKMKVTYNSIEITGLLPWLQENGVHVTFETDVAYCKKCSTTLSLDSHILKEHIKQHQTDSKNTKAFEFTSHVELKDNAKNKVMAKLKCEQGETEALATSNNMSNQHKEVDSKNTQSSKCTSPVLKHDDKDKSEVSIPKIEKDEIEDLLRSNNMEFVHNEKSIYCKSCNIKMSDTLKTVNNHIKTWAHKKKSQKQNRNIKITHLKKMCLDDFLNSLIDTDPSNINSDVVINDKICLTYFSFMFYTCIMRDNRRFRCQACEINLTEPDVRFHHTSEMHVKAFNKIPVVTSAELTSEFVREVRPNIYHCGFCNIIILSWENMDLHLKSVEHHTQKRQSESRLHHHKPTIQRHKLQRHFERQLLGFFLTCFE